MKLPPLRREYCREGRGTFEREPSKKRGFSHHQSFKHTRGGGEERSLTGYVFEIAVGGRREEGRK